MGGNRQHINIIRFNVHGDMPYRLHRVGVKNHAARTAEPAYFGNRLNCANFVIGVHYGNQSRVFSYCRRNFFGGDYAVFVHVEISYFKPFFFKFFKGMEYGVMLESSRNYMFFALCRAV